MPVVVVKAVGLTIFKGHLSLDPFWIQMSLSSAAVLVHASWGPGATIYICALGSEHTGKAVKLYSCSEFHVNRSHLVLITEQGINTVVLF